MNIVVFLAFSVVLLKIKITVRYCTTGITGLEPYGVWPYFFFGTFRSRSRPLLVARLPS